MITVRIHICKIPLQAILIFFVLSGSLFSIHTADDDETIMGNVFSEREDGFAIIVVEKSSNTLFWVNVKSNIPRVTKSYTVITGKNNGDKEKDGDEKTPEGIYFVTGYIPGHELKSPLYGEGAFPISYPNIVDKIHGKTGSGIWIHGRDMFSQDVPTRGCVSLSNQDFQDLKSRISFGTPVIISEKLEFVPSDVYNQIRARHLDFLMKFIAAWENSEFEKYSDYFHEKFRSVSGLSYKSYLMRKRNLMKIYPERRINISDISITKENGNELAYTFNQLYCSANVLSFGRKVLYCALASDGTYKIVAEEFYESSPEHLLEISIKKFVSRWKDSWKSQILNDYLSFYDAAFTNGRLNLQSWKDYKEEIFNSAHIADIKIKNVSIDVLSPQRVKVTFEQEYVSENYSDVGLKTLILTGCGSEYKIVSEKWRPF